ncbi:hypothetical protein [Neoroseomonas rubea]|uniref:hypothetical protein n=1 Tax=Neoroseomonas rubea TaxID=2748666 RepID=UPI0018DF68A1|nr:hypothetical protein [Roseomonas rubea]
MRGIGVLEDGYEFSWEELERGTPRFWWGPRKRAAFDRALAKRGMSRKDGESEGQEDRSDDAHDWQRDRDRTTGAGVAIVAFEEKRGEGGGGYETKESASSASTDSGGSSDSGGSDGGGGGSGE